MKKLYNFNDYKNQCPYIGFPRNIAWPCRVYRITLPKTKRNVQGRLNAFEVCILKLLAYGRYEPKDLAYETCLPPELIKIILLRLYDMEKIDKYNQLTPDTLKELEKYDNEKESEPIEYETKVIFQECMTGTLLPMLEDAKLQAEEVDENGNFKNKKLKNLWRLFAAKKDFNMPTPRDVISAIKTMSRRSITSDELLKIPSANYISVASGQESCDILVRMVMQENGDWRILNPFGKNWSLELESAYQKILKDNENEEKNFNKWIESFKRDSSQGKSNNHITYPFETQDNYKRYRELIIALRRCMENNNEEKAGSFFYSAIEWALFYALKECESTNKEIQLLHAYSKKDNDARILNAINSLGFLKKKDFHFSNFQNKIESFQNYNTADMSLVVPLAILVAKADEQFAFNKICKTYPKILSMIPALKEKRDKSMHGSNNFTQIYGKEDYKFITDVITTLIPSVQFSDSSSAHTDKDEIIDARLDAQNKLREAFGAYLFETMDNILKRELTDAEIFRSKINKAAKVDVLPCIVNLYAAVQCTFRPLLNAESSFISNPIAVAQDNAKLAGWGELPQSIKKIRMDLLQHTLEGNDQTLGACIVTWLIRTEQDVLNMIAEKQPELINNLDVLLKLRSHGNKSIKMQQEELNTFVNKIYKIIRTIMEA